MRNKIICLIVVIGIYSFLTLSWFVYTEYSGSLTQSLTKIDSPSLDTINPPSPPTPELQKSSSTSLTNKGQFLEEYSEVIYYEPPQSTCQAQDLHFTEEEYKRIFNFRKYSACQTPTDDVIYLDDDFIYAECVEGEAEFSVDPGLPQRLGGEVKDEVVWSFDNKIGERSEYAFIRCGKSLYSLFFIRFNQVAADRANKIRFSRKHDPKPMNVFVLVFDSLSRFTSYKFMPKFTEYLAQRIKSSEEFSDFSVYEFTRFGLPEIYTLPNMAQILYGEDFEEMRKKLNVKKPDRNKESPEHLAYQKEKSIWNYYMNQGYVTLFTKDTVYDFLNRFIGREITADHVFENYWRSAWSVYGFDDFSNRQRCYGRQNSHNLTLGYAYDFFEKYKNYNKFAYVHLDAAHENTGNIQTVDEELRDFIKSLTGLFQKRNENFMIYIMSDHGFKFEKLMFDVRSFIENTSPLAYLLISQEVEQKLNARENLLHNSQMLTGRYDLNLMLKYLAHYPYDMPDKSYFEEIKKSYKVESAINLLTEKASSYRKCSELGVAKNRCICSWFEPIRRSDKAEMEIVHKFFPLVNQYFEHTAKSPGCNSLSYLKYLKGQKFNIHGMSKGYITFYELEFLANNETVVEAKFNFCFENRVKRGMKKLQGELYPSSDYMVGKDKAFIQLSDLKVNKECGEVGCLC